MCLVKRVRKSDPVAMLGMIVSVTTTYVRQKEGSVTSRSRFSLMLDMNTLASKGPREDPIRHHQSVRAAGLHRTGTVVLW